MAAPDAIRGRSADVAAIYRRVHRRAQARGDKLFEVAAIQKLADGAARGGDVTRAARMLDSVLPLVERDRDPGRYATVVADLGDVLIALGDFDRALMLQTAALEVFS